MAGARTICALALAGTLLVAPSPAGAAPAGAIRKVAVRGTHLAWRATGHGRPLLLINGSGATLDTWDPLLLNALGRTRRVIVYDPRGLGATTGRGTRSVADDAADAAALLRALHIRSADVLGWSYGGWVAQEMAITHGRSVRRLVLASTDTGGLTARQPSPRYRALDSKSTLGHASLDELLDLLFPRAAWPLGRAWIQRLVDQPGSCCEATPRAALQAVLNAQDRWYSRGQGTAARLSRLRIPVLIGAGARDNDVPAANARTLARLIHGSRRIVYGDAGHAFLVQHSADFAARVRRFLG